MKFGGRLKKKNVMTFQFRRDSLFRNNISEIVWNINSFVILLLIDLYTKLWMKWIFVILFFFFFGLIVLELNYKPRD